jgi:hypothetical protein
MLHWITKDNAEIVSAWATSAAVLVALVASCIALLQLRHIRKDSRDRTRPYVHLDVVPGLHGPGSWDLVLENKGASTAVDVIVDAGRINPQSKDDNIASTVPQYLLAPKTLVPGARRRIRWGYRLVDEEGNEKLRMGVLDPHKLTVTYLDEWRDRFWWRRWRKYKAAFTVGDAFMLPVFPAPTEGNTSTANDDTVLKDINLALRALNTHVGELRR